MQVGLVHAFSQLLFHKNLFFIISIAVRAFTVTVLVLVLVNRSWFLVLIDFFFIVGFFLRRNLDLLLVWLIDLHHILLYRELFLFFEENNFICILRLLLLDNATVIGIKLCHRYRASDLHDRVDLGTHRNLLHYAWFLLEWLIILLWDELNHLRRWWWYSDRAVLIRAHHCVLLTFQWRRWLQSEWSTWLDWAFLFVFRITV